MVLRPLTARGQRLTRTARQGFRRDLPNLLVEPLRALAPSSVLNMLAEPNPTPPALDLRDRVELRLFADGRRGYELCIGPLRQLVVSCLRDPHFTRRLTPEDRLLLVAKVLQHRPWAEVVAALQHHQGGCHGRGVAETRLRQLVRPMMAHWLGGYDENIDPMLG